MDHDLQTSKEAVVDKLASRSQSPVPYIERYLSSPELSASIETIQDALNDDAYSRYSRDPLGMEISTESGRGQQRRCGKELESI